MKLQKEIRFISAFRIINLNYMLKIIKILRKGCNWFITTLRLINIYFPCLLGGDHTWGTCGLSLFCRQLCVCRGEESSRKDWAEYDGSMWRIPQAPSSGHIRSLSETSILHVMVSLCPQTQPLYSFWFDGFTVLIYTVNKLRQKYKDKTHFCMCRQLPFGNMQLVWNWIRLPKWCWGLPVLNTLPR